MKLRLTSAKPPLHLVLVEPEIPPNTGNIARLCAATGTRLHLVGKLGFSIDDRAVRRAGLDYWHLVQVEQHDDLTTCLAHIGDDEPLLFTTKTHRSFTQAPYSPSSVLVFGGESKGLPAETRAAHEERCFAIPTCAGSVRSLNLANAAAVVVYEALRATGRLDQTMVEQ